MASLAASSSSSSSSSAAAAAHSGRLPLATYHRAAALGEGSFGSVVTVYDDEGREFAFKMFANDEDDDTLDLGTLREVSALRVLRAGNGHAGLVPMHDVQPPGDETKSGEGMLCMAMPKYGVGDLERLLNSGAFPTGSKGRKARIRIAHDLLSAVAFLNDNCAMHRDIKADNVMLTDDFRPVLIDFSLVKFVDGPMAMLPPGSTHTGEIGTPTYTAPEVVAQRPYGTKTDSWSCGVVLLEMLRGRTLTCEKDAAAFKLIEEAKASLPDKPFANLVRSLLEADPEKRASCREALSAPVFAAAGLAVPAVRLIDFETAIPAPRADGASSSSDDAATASDDSENSSGGHTNTAGGGGTKRGRGGAAKKERKGGAGLSEKEAAVAAAKDAVVRKDIVKLCAELKARENPAVEAAAHMYCRRMQACGYEIRPGAKALRDCVVLAEKFFSVDARNLDDLADDCGEQFPSFGDWDVESYKTHEAAIFAAMDYCLLLRGEFSGVASAAGGAAPGKKSKKARRA